MIREYCETDLSGCAKLIISAYNGEPWHDEWTFEKAVTYVDEFACYRNFVGFVAEDDNGEIIGAIFARWRTWWDIDEIYVDELCVNPADQNKGHGKKLLSHMEQYGVGRGVSRVTLTTNRLAPAKAFYEKNGYTLFEHIVFFSKRFL